MKVLVTGSNGQVGHCLVEQLQGNAEVLALGAQELDITKEQDVFDTVNTFKPDVIINAAAYTSVDRAELEQDLSYKVNCDGPRYLAHAAQSIGASIIHISTDYVFEGNKDGLYNEDDITNPQGVYGASKLAGEQAVIKACAKHIILRTAWVFCEHGNNFVKTMLRLGQESDALSIVGDQFGGPTYAGDIAAALTNIALQCHVGKEAWGIYHFSGMPHVNWYQFADTIFTQAFKQKVLEKVPKLKSIDTHQYPTPAKRPTNSQLDCHKIEKVFGIKPSDWQYALTKIKEYQI
ncbi:dTDP-4-dehydrorhamnose reductase [Shewanella halotolerans]|uniref:dTDP-4-dehydrorhamnose reductase n=1 Tax=Shewanella halotolerans TaxID=2864204 RepID=UPI001C656792|nr:dTDP-4-dehydrorhamnose reductase [Shewanella halotolerans]QYJ88709.1 dTDP-4-dehydrorhamnose reductase [Shewanella halotolerans]